MFAFIASGTPLEGDTKSLLLELTTAVGSYLTAVVLLQNYFRVILGLSRNLVWET